MDCLGVEVPISDTKRAKRERKLSLSLSGKSVGIKQTVDGAKKETMERSGGDCTETSSLLELQLPGALLPPKTSSPPKKSAVFKVPSPIKQAVGPRQRKPKDKRNSHENGTIISVAESSKQVACENFFLPASKKRKLLKQIPTEEDNVVTSQGIKRRIEEVSSAGLRSAKDVPPDLAPMRAEASGVEQHSPKAKKVSSKTLSSSSQVSEIGLHAKAALDAKENALQSAGKPIHPLFLRAKSSTTKIASPYSDARILEPCPPIHVTQFLEEEGTQINWEISSFPRASPTQRCKEEDLVARLLQSGHKLQDHLLVSRSSSSYQDNSTKLQKMMDTLSEDSAAFLANSGVSHVNTIQHFSSQRGLENLLEYLQQSTKPERKFTGAYVNPYAGSHVLSIYNSMEKLKERLSWYTVRHDPLSSDKDKGSLGSQKNMLWTDRYQPKSSKEVCGNATAVEFLNNWLHSWREKMMGQVNCPDLSQKKVSPRNHDTEGDRGWFEDDSDTDTDTDEESGFHSTLLVTGPTGCGKSAAIYACAAEQGLTVIEVNASSCRTGASILQKFGRGGLESQAMGKWSTVEDQNPSVNEANGKEADGSHRMPNYCGKVSPQGLAKGRRESKARVKNASKNSRNPVGTSVVGRKLFDSCAPNGCEENFGMSVEEPQPGSPQKKKMTVILFEDVDVHFEEDRGFLTALVQLSKKTKRPIILTSNSRQPGLPQILEKARIDFCYPSPEDLTLHASMVCIAEGVACSPWMANRLVGSCQNDIRKVMMALQFWRQDACLSPRSSLQSTLGGSESFFDHVQGLTARSVSETLRESRRHLSLRLPRTCSSGIPDLCEKKVSPAIPETIAFTQWDVEARYLYELDIHHIILPDLFTRNFPCLLSLDVAKKINAAVSELEKQETMIAVKDAEEQGLAIRAQLNAADAERKVLRRAKDAMRRASRMKAEVVEEGVSVLENLLSNNDTEGDSVLNKMRLSESPVKNVREARALARTNSPLKTKSVKPKRALLLYNSDNDEEGQVAQVQADDCLSCISNLYSDGVQATEVQDSNVVAPANVGVSEDLEDKDVMLVPSCESFAPVRRRRLLQDLECDLPGSALRANVEVSFTTEIGNEDVSMMTVACSEDFERLPPCQILSSSTMLETDIDEKLVSDGRHSVTGWTQKDVEQCVHQDDICKPIMDLETENLDPSLPEVKAEKAKLTGERVVFDLDLKAIEYVNVNHVNRCNPDSREVNNAGSELHGILDSKVIGASGEGRSPGRDVDNVTAVEKLGVRDVEDSTSLSSESLVKVAGDLEAADTADAFVLEESKHMFLNPVQEAWRTMREDRQALRDSLGPVQPSMNVSDALATILEVISASNSISSFSSESLKNDRTSFSGTWNGTFEGNIGHCCFWESCQEVASQLVRAGLQKFSTSLLVTPRCETRVTVTLGILSAAKDVPAVGKCMVTCDNMRSIYKSANQFKSIDCTYSKEETTRQIQRQERLDEIIRTRLLPRGRISGVSLLDYIAYLARISQSEEHRRMQTASESKRSRRFQHHLSSKMSEADISEIFALCKIGKA